MGGGCNRCEEHCDGLLRYYPAFLTPAERDDAFMGASGLPMVASPAELVPGTTAFVNRQEFTCYGKTCRMQRAQAFLCNVAGVTGYKFSGVEAPRQTMPPFVEAIMARVREAAQCPELNACLVNCYDAEEGRNGKLEAAGKSYISQHADDEGGLVGTTPIAAVSIGAQRTFRVTQAAGGKRVLDLKMADGSLLVMMPGFQRRYKHGVPVEAKVRDVRYSFTFRAHKQVDHP